MATAFRRRAFRLAPDLAAVALVAVTVLAGPAVLHRLPAEMVVGWHVGPDGAVSRTYGPRLVGLVALPAHAVGLLAVAWVTRRLAGLESGTGERRLFDLVVGLLLAWLCAAQLSLLSLNL